MSSDEAIVDVGATLPEDIAAGVVDTQTGMLLGTRGGVSAECESRDGVALGRVESVPTCGVRTVVLDGPERGKPKLDE